MMGKKGMGVQQVFIFILLALVVGLTLIFGYKAISNLVQKGEETAMLQFKQELKNDIESMSAEVGSVQSFSYDVPGGVEEVCFVDFGAECSTSSAGATCLAPSNTLVSNIYEADKSTNVYFVKSGGSPDVDYIKGIMVEEDRGGDTTGTCLPVEKGILSLRLEGKGNGALVQ